MYVEECGDWISRFMDALAIQREAPVHCVQGAYFLCWTSNFSHSWLCHRTEVNFIQFRASYIPVQVTARLLVSTPPSTTAVPLSKTSNLSTT